MTLDLFESLELGPQKIVLPGAELFYWQNFYSPTEAQHWYEQLLASVQWQERMIRMYGRDVKVPRLSAWYADPGKEYTYSEALHKPCVWTAELNTLRQDLHVRTEAQFNSVLCNLYRDGQDSVAWHSDDEPELGVEPVIASLSFGETRSFQMRRKDNHQQKYTLELISGSCLLMRGTTQALWQHQIAKTNKALGPRINLTFRLVS